jgi:tRNA pseudouridine65 synthase
MRIIESGDGWVAVDKASGWVVHRSGQERNAPALLQAVRDALGCRVYPLHRLDRGSSGIVLMASNPSSARLLSSQLERGCWQKGYIGLARGWVRETRIIDCPLKDDRGCWQEAWTSLEPSEHFELPHPCSRHATARLTLCSFSIRSGRTHQIRRHSAHIRHPLLGDSRYGDLRQNRLFREQTGLQRLMLHANFLAFPGQTAEWVTIHCPPDENWNEAIAFLRRWRCQLSPLQGEEDAQANFS